MRIALLILALVLTPALDAQWEIQDSHVTADLRGIHSLGGGVAWASGSHGTLLRTEDNGTNWHLCAIPPDAEKLDFRGIQAFDAKTAIVMSSGKGDLSRLYKTTDGCQTWKLVFTNPDKDGFWDAIQANLAAKRDRFHVLVAGDPVNGSFTLFYLDVALQGNSKPQLQPFPRLFCRDENIALQLPLPTRKCVQRVLDITNKEVAPQNRLKGIPEHYQTPVPRDGEALFAASNSSLAFGPDVWYAPNISFVTGGPLGPRFLHLRSTPCAGKGCEEWVKADLPLPKGDAGGAFSLSWKGKDYQFGVVVGGDYKKPDEGSGTAAYSEQEGHRRTAATTPPHGYRSAVAYDPTTKTWITVGPNGTDISTDDGRNWRALEPSPTDAPDADKHWNALSLPFGVGPHGRIGLLRPDALSHTP